jgi:hypothetical protein
MRVTKVIAVFDLLVAMMVAVTTPLRVAMVWGRRVIQTRFVSLRQGVAGFRQQVNEDNLATLMTAIPRNCTHKFLLALGWMGSAVLAAVAPLAGKNTFPGSKK